MRMAIEELKKAHQMFDNRNLLQQEGVVKNIRNN